MVIYSCNNNQAPTNCADGSPPPLPHMPMRTNMFSDSQQHAAMQSPSPVISTPWACDHRTKAT